MPEYINRDEYPWVTSDELEAAVVNARRLGITRKQIVKKVAEGLITPGFAEGS